MVFAVGCEIQMRARIEEALCPDNVDKCEAIAVPKVRGGTDKLSGVD